MENREVLVTQLFGPLETGRPTPLEFIHIINFILCTPNWFVDYPFSLSGFGDVLHIAVISYENVRVIDVFLHVSFDIFLIALGYIRIV